MALLAEVGAAIAAAGLASSSGAGGFQLLLSWLPDSTGLQDRAAALVELPLGEPPTIGRQELDRAALQLTVRGASLLEASSAYPEAYACAQGIKLALQELVLTSSSGRYLPGILADGDPYLLGYDERRRPLIGCGFKVWRSRT